jgi:spermidine/putrescine transport system substrate-binding protein
MTVADRPSTGAALLSTPISRRRALQLGAAAGAAAFLGATSATRVTAQEAPVTGSFKIATWIGYIDIGEDGVSHPSLDRFTQETGITVDYQEAVDDNETFYAAQLQGPLQAGLPTGWDLVVLTDWMIQRLASYGWLEQLDLAAMPNYAANLQDIYRARDWDPGNQLAAPWQSGMGGLGYDQAVTGPLSSIDILFAPDYAGRVTYLSEMRDTVGLSALRLGFDPSTLTQEQFDAALSEIRTAVDSGTVRQITGNSYINDMATGDVVLAVAWSGDIPGLLVPEQGEGQDFQWTLPDEGGTLWTDNMAVPKGAANKAQAQVFIDWYYVPENAAQISAYVQYVSPVKGAAEAIAAIEPALATNTFIFPDEAMVARLHEFRALDLDTSAAWQAAFNEVAGL